MTEQDHWTDVDRYFAELLLAPDPALDESLRASTAAGLPSIHVAPNQGKFLHLLARALNPRNILEIGTLGGYSTIWLARALSAGGRLVTLESNPTHAELARANLARAGVADRVELILAPAIETLPRLVRESRGPFDFVFIDADKPPTADYFDWSLRLSRPGTVIVVDNVVRKGAVVDADSADADVQGIRRFAQALASDKRVTATAVQTVGGKGYDGFVMAIVNKT
jgi:predicted O-methyltransferase YrrM